MDMTIFVQSLTLEELNELREVIASIDRAESSERLSVEEETYAAKDNGYGTIMAIKLYRARTGKRLKESHDAIYEWQCSKGLRDRHTQQWRE